MKLARGANRGRSNKGHEFARGKLRPSLHARTLNLLLGLGECKQLLDDGGHCAADAPDIAAAHVRLHDSHVRAVGGVECEALGVFDEDLVDGHQLGVNLRRRQHDQVDCN